MTPKQQHPNTERFNKILCLTSLELLSTWQWWLNQSLTCGRN